MLQYAERAQRKDSKKSTPILISRSDNLAYAVLGIPTNVEGSPFVWILLGGGDDSYGSIKMMPQGIAFRIDCNFVNNTPKKYAADKTVLMYLQKNCRSGAERVYMHICIYGQADLRNKDIEKPLSCVNYYNFQKISCQQ